jgi:hypothetical protein
VNWYYGFALAVLLLWIFSSPKDKMALRIILLATIGSMIITTYTRTVNAPWKLIVPATVEMLTIIALLHWARNRTGYTQAGLLVIAWAAHLICYLDLMLGTDLVYSAYERVILLVAVGQVLACHETVRHNWTLLGDYLFRGGRVGPVRGAGGDASLSHDKGGPRI